MIGNLSKSKGIKGDPFKYEDFTPEELEGLRGPQGVKGDIGNTAAITFKYDANTGDLSYTSDGILVDKEYVDSNNLATKGDIHDLRAYFEEKLAELSNSVKSKIGSITLYANKWVQVETHRWNQVVNVDNATVTIYSKVDLQISEEQSDIFKSKDLSFTVTNKDGVVTVSCVGQKPTNDYTIQATVTEVTIDA